MMETVVTTMTDTRIRGDSSSFLTSGVLLTLLRRADHFWNDVGWTSQVDGPDIVYESASSVARDPFSLQFLTCSPEQVQQLVNYRLFC